jgi:hypothetical protein
MTSMTRRERLRRCYFLEDLDRPAVYSRTGFPGDDPTYDRLKAYLAAHTELKTPWHTGHYQAAPPVEHRIEPHTDDFDREVRVLHAPAGDLRATSLVSRTGQPGLHETFYIQSAEDAETYLSLPPPEAGGDVSTFFEADAAMGGAGIVDVVLGMNAAGTVAELCGSEHFAMLTMTHRELVARLCEREMQALLRRVDFLLDAGVGPYFSMLGQEYVVPPLHGPRDFDDFNVRYDKPVINRVHERGGRMHVHSHGAIRQVFRGFVAMGADVLHPFEAPPSGDITAREAKALARGHLCLEGNIQIHRMYDATPDEVRAETEQLIADTFDDAQGLIVSPTASPYIFGQGEVCYPRYEAMIDAVLATGT